MPFIKRHHIDPKIRGQHDKAHKSQLRQALLNPALTEEQRAGLQKQLREVGQKKAYHADSAPKPGAISFEDVSENQ